MARWDRDDDESRREWDRQEKRRKRVAFFFKPVSWLFKPVSRLFSWPLIFLLMWLLMAGLLGWLASREWPCQDPCQGPM